MNKKEIALVDCDSFYVSCEQLLNPELKNKPVCVMSNNNGCVVARSKEAKKIGIKMGMPVFMAKKEFPQAIYIPGRLGVYGEISKRIMTLLKEFSPVVEIYSIDEAFIDLTGLRRMYKKDYIEIAREIKTQVYQQIGIPVSIGSSHTKVLAKLATERAKQTDGVYRIGSREINNELKKTDLINVWGIGVNSAELLKKFQIKTAYQLTLTDNFKLNKLLGKKGLELKQELLGTSIYEISNKYTAPKSIQKTSSFAKFTSDKNYIKNSLKYHTHRGCKKLRKHGLKAKTVNVILKTKEFKTYTGSKVLIEPTNWEFDIFTSVKEIFEEIYIPEINYRSSGVILSDLKESAQLSLFESSPNREKISKITATLDIIEAKYKSLL